MSVNKVILVGRVGNKPEIRATQQGKEIANFSIATSQKWKDKHTGQQKEKTEWHRVVVFSESLVNVIKRFVDKGSQLYVEGELSTRKWQDKDGVDKYNTEIILQGYRSSLQLLDSKNKQEQSSDNFNAAQSVVQPAEQSVEIDDDEIPF